MSKDPAPRQPSARRRGRAPFDVDRVVVLRVALGAVALVFLYLIVKVSMIAFGGSSARETKRIERAVDPTAAASAERAPPPPNAGAPR